MELIGWIVFVFVLLHAVNIIHTWQQILKIVIPYTSDFKREDVFFVPEYMRDLYSDFQSQIDEGLFEFFDYYSAINVFKQRIPIILYKSKRENTFITITAPYLCNNPNRLGITVSSICDDGKRVVHNNFNSLHAYFALPHEIHINEEAAGIDVLTCHQKYLTDNKMRASQHHIDTSVMYAEAQDDTEIRFNDQVNKKKITKTDKGYCFTIAYAFVVAIKLVLAKKKASVDCLANINKLEKKPVTEARQAYFFDILEEKNKTVLNSQAKWVFFGLSLLASIILGVIIFDWDTMITVTVVIFIHELGHWSMMRLFGYQNAQLFFIPLLGGVATAKTDKFNRNYQTWILLMGPLPGIIIGLVMLSLYWFGTCSYSITTLYQLRSWGWMFFVINAINLLPFRPLDGGQLVDILFPSNHIIKTCITTVVSVVAVATAMYFDLHVLGLIFALPLLFQFIQRKHDKIERMVATDTSKKAIFLQLCQLDPQGRLYTHYHSAQSLYLERHAAPLYWMNRIVIIISLLPMVAVVFYLFYLQLL